MNFIGRFDKKISSNRVNMLKSKDGEKESMSTAEIKERYTCFDLLGEAVKKVAGGYLYRCPWREDAHPSLSVSNDGRGWHDFATGEHGSVIDLALKVWNTSSVSEVCSRFGEKTLSFPQPFIPIKNRAKEKVSLQSAFAQFNIVPLQSDKLLAYLGSRNVNIEIAKLLCSEAHYSFRQEGSALLSAIAFPNDVGGYELRGAPYPGNEKGFKGTKAPKGISTISNVNNAPVVVFEGFTDMLSFATLCGGIIHNYIVLNSVALVDRAIENLHSYDGKIFLSLDNDTAGDEASRKIQEAFPQATDLRSRFAPCKDVNEYLSKK